MVLKNVFLNACMLERWIATINKGSFMVLCIKHTAMAIESLVIFKMDSPRETFSIFFSKRNINFLNKIQGITNVYNVKGISGFLSGQSEKGTFLLISSATYSLC